MRYNVSITINKKLRNYIFSAKTLWALPFTLRALLPRYVWRIREGIATLLGLHVRTQSGVSNEAEQGGSSHVPVPCQSWKHGLNHHVPPAKRTNSSRSVAAVERFLMEKRKQERLKEIDATTGTRYYERYMRKKGRVRNVTSVCCQGKGHRGRLKKKKKICTIL